MAKKSVVEKRYEILQRIDKGYSYVEDVSWTIPETRSLLRAYREKYPGKKFYAQKVIETAERLDL